MANHEAKYIIRDEAGNHIGDAHDSKSLEAFWNGPGLYFSVIDSFGSKRTKLVFIVREIK